MEDNELKENQYEICANIFFREQHFYCCSSPQSNIYLLMDGWMNGQTYFSKRNQDCLTWVFVSEYQMEMYFACNNFNYIGEIRVRQLDQTFILKIRKGDMLFTDDTSAL